MPNELTFYLLALLTLAGAVAAMSLRNLVHCALCAAGAFAGLAMVYLQLNAEFVGFAQFLVYVGAVAILIVFTVLLTRGADIKAGASRASSSWISGVAVAILVFLCLATPILNSPSLQQSAQPRMAGSVKQIGEELMGGCVLPLETTGLLLTAALLGAVVIAMNDKPASPRKSGIPARGRQVEEEVSAP